MHGDLSKKNLETLRAVFTKFPSINSVRLFGSRAAKTARRASDIDLAIFAPEMTNREWSRLQETLEEASIIYRLDVVRFETLANETLRNRILSDGVVIYTK